MIELKFTEEQIVKRVINKYLFKKYKSLSLLKNGYWMYFHVAEKNYYCFNNKNLENKTLYAFTTKKGIQTKSKTSIFETMQSIRIKGSNEGTALDEFLPTMYVNYIKHIINKKKSQ